MSNEELPQLDEEVPSAQEQKRQFMKFADECTQIREEVIPTKREEAKAKELYLRKIVAQLKKEGYNQNTINKILQYHASKELFDDIVRRYDESGAPPPDISDLGF